MEKLSRPISKNPILIFSSSDFICIFIHLLNGFYLYEDAIYALSNLAIVQDS